MQFPRLCTQHFCKNYHIPPHFLRKCRFRLNWLRVFKRANPAHLCSGHTPERETGPLPSEKCVARCGSEYDEIRMSTVRFARVLERCTGHLRRHFLLTFQDVRLVRKTCNQLKLKKEAKSNMAVYTISRFY